MENSKNWADIHEDFIKKPALSENENYQQEWESYGLNYQDAEEWIKVGFEPLSYFEVRIWKDFGFTSWEARVWMNNGLKKNDAEFAFYLKSKNYKLEGLSFEQAKDNYIQQIRTDGIQAQEWLDILFPEEKRKEKKNLWIDNKNLIGSLDLSDFIELEELWCSGNRLTSLNNLGKKIKVISAWNNKFDNDLSIFSHLIYLEDLDISENFFLVAWNI